MTAHTDTKGHSVLETHREYKLKYVLDYKQNTLITKCCPLGWGCDLVQCLPGASSSKLHETRTASLLQREVGQLGVQVQSQPRLHVTPRLQRFPSTPQA